MRKLILLLALAASAFGQGAFLDDNKCLNIVGATNSNPVTLTCDEAHGFDSMRAFARIFISPNVQDGDSFTISGPSGAQTYTFKAVLDSTPNEIAIGADTFTSANNIFHAMNHDTGSGTLYSSTTPLVQDVYCPGTSGQASAYIYAITPGLPGRSINLTSNTSRITFTSIKSIWTLTHLEINWTEALSGATGAWASLNRNPVNDLVWDAIYVSPTQFKVNFNSTSAGSFTGQTVTAERVNGFVQYLAYSNNPQDTRAVVNHRVQFTVPSSTCTPEMTDAQCSLAFVNPENTKLYRENGGVSIISPIVVDAGGVGTITFNGIWHNTNNPCSHCPPLTVGQLGFIVGSTAFPDLINGLENGYRVQSMTTINGGTQTQITFNAGVAAGNYATTSGQFVTTWPVGVNFWYSTEGNPNAKTFPGSILWWNMKGGDLTMSRPNRMRMPVKYGKNISRPPGDKSCQTTTCTTFLNTAVMSLGTYPANQSSQDSHFYHSFGPMDYYAGEWTLYEATSTADHNVGVGGGNNDYPDEPGINPFVNALYRPLMPYHMAHTNFYLETGDGITDSSGQTVTLGLLTLDQVNNEPDELVSSRVLAYSTQRYDTSGNLTIGPGLTMAWATVPSQRNWYEVRWSSSDMHTAGFSTGLCHNGTTSCDSTDTITNIHDDQPAYVGAFWQSSNISRQATAYVAVRPTGLITGVAIDAANNRTWVNTHNDYNIALGDKVTVAGATGISGLNQTAVANVGSRRRQVWMAKAPSPDLLNQSDTWTLPGQLNDITASGGGGSGETCVATLTVNHNLLPGMVILVGNSTNDTLGGVSGNSKDYTISSVTANTMTFPCPFVPDNVYNADHAMSFHFGISAYPAVALPGVATGTWTSGTGKFTPAEDLKGFSQIALATVDTILQSSPTSIAAAYTIGGSSPASQTVNLTAIGVSSTTAWTASKTQSWLSLSKSSGASTPDSFTATIDGTGLAAGTYTDSIALTGGTTTPSPIPVTLTVYAALSITTGTLPRAVPNQPYTAHVAVSGGQLPYACSVATGALPSGISIANDSTGCVISGTPTTISVSSFTIGVSEAGAATATSGPLSLVVAGIPGSTLHGLTGH